MLELCAHQASCVTAADDVLRHEAKLGGLTFWLARLSISNATSSLTRRFAMTMPMAAPIRREERKASSRCTARSRLTSPSSCSSWINPGPGPASNPPSRCADRPQPRLSLASARRSAPEARAWLTSARRSASSARASLASARWSAASARVCTSWMSDRPASSRDRALQAGRETPGRCLIAHQACPNSYQRTLRTIKCAPGDRVESTPVSRGFQCEAARVSSSRATDTAGSGRDTGS